MSFSTDVKKEISSNTLEACCMKAELYTIIRFRSEVVISLGSFGVELITTLSSTVREIVRLFKKLYNVDLEIIAIKKEKLDYKTRFRITLKENGTKILQDLKIIDENYNLIDEINYDLFKKDCCKMASVRGAFLIQGSISNPEKKNRYYLEIVAPSIEDANFLVETLDQVDIDAKVLERKKGFVVYVNKAEHISDFLRYTGAINSLFAFEDVRIEKDSRNYANRMANCDIANGEKSIKAAKKQLKDIAYLNEHYGLLKLSPRLMDAVILRNSYPDDSLSELSERSEEVIGRYISKSGLSHCFNDLARLVEGLKK